MNSNTSLIIFSFIFFGWIPILAIGKAIAMIIEAYKNIE